MAFAIKRFTQKNKPMPRMHSSQQHAGDLLQAEKLHLQGRLQESWALYKKVLADGDHFAALNGMGLIAAQTKRFDVAIDLFRNAIKVDKTNPRGFNNLANALVSKGDREAALGYLDEALILDEAYVDALKNRGLIRAELKQFSQALDDFARVLQLQPDYWRAHIYKANVLIAMGELDSALKSYERVLANHPDSAALSNNLGAILCSLRHFDQALPHIDYALAINPRYAEAYNNRAVVMIGLGRHGDALDAYQHALAIKPDYSDALHGKASLEKTFKSIRV